MVMTTWTQWTTVNVAVSLWMGYAPARIDWCEGEKKRQSVQLKLIRNRNQRMDLLLLKYLAKKKKVELNWIELQKLQVLFF